MKKFLLIIVLFQFSIINSQTIPRQRSNSNKFYISTSVGAAFRIGETPSGLNSVLKDYLSDLKSGSSFNLGFYYRASENAGLGFKYNVFSSKASLSNVGYKEPNGLEGSGTISDDITIRFYGASYTMDNNNSDTKHEGNLEISLGYITFSDFTQFTNRYEITGGNLGLTASFGYKYKFSKFFSVGPQLNFITGTLREYKITGPNGYNNKVSLKKENYESLTRIDLSLEATFRF
jgi:long-subunit fatty acid transport protein